MSLIKQIGVLLVLVAIAGGGYAAYERYALQSEKGGGGFRRGGGGPVPVETQVAEMRKVEDQIEAVGTTLARKAVEIVPLATGQIREIAFEPGQMVREGDVLVALDDDIQRADLVEAEAKLDQANLAIARAEKLIKSNTVSRASIELLLAAQATARGQRDRAIRRLADRKVRAPFAGIVGLRQVDIGARVDEKTMMTTLDDLSEVEIEFSLPETVFGQIKIGLPIKADSSAFPERNFTGAITSIDSRVDTVSRSFKVRAIVPNEDLSLPSGMFMHLSVILDASQRLIISEEALTAEGETNSVYVVNDGKAVRTVVTLGKRGPGFVEITEGLAAGDVVVVRGVQRLRDGSAVRKPGDPPQARKNRAGRPGGGQGAAQGEQRRGGQGGEAGARKRQGGGAGAGAERRRRPAGGEGRQTGGGQSG